MIAQVNEALALNMQSAGLTGLAEVVLFATFPRTTPPTLELASIWSTSVRGQGHGSRALAVLTATADELGVALTLEPYFLLYDTAGDPPGPQADRLDVLNERYLRNEELILWYQRNGFVITGDPTDEHPRMRRDPVPQ